MRSDLPRFRKPRPPKIDPFLDHLEHQLRQEIERNPPRPRKALRLFERVGRLLLRPVFPAVTVVGLFIVALVAVRPQTSLVMGDAANTDPAIETISRWAEVVEVPDPSPRFVPVVRVLAPRLEAFAFTHPAPLPDPPAGFAPF